MNKHLTVKLNNTQSFYDNFNNNNNNMVNNDELIKKRQELLLKLAEIEQIFNNNTTDEIISSDNNTTGEIISSDNNTTGEIISSDNNTTGEIISSDNNISYSICNRPTIVPIAPPPPPLPINLNRDTPPPNITTINVDNNNNKNNSKIALINKINDNKHKLSQMPLYNKRPAPINFLDETEEYALKKKNKTTNLQKDDFIPFNNSKSNKRYYNNAHNNNIDVFTNSTTDNDSQNKNYNRNKYFAFKNNVTFLDYSSFNFLDSITISSLPKHILNECNKQLMEILCNKTIVFNNSLKFIYGYYFEKYYNFQRNIRDNHTLYVIHNLIILLCRYNGIMIIHGFFKTHEFIKI